MKTTTQKLHWRSIVRHYWPFVRKYRGMQVLLFIGYGGGSLLTAVAMPLLYKEMMDTISLGGDTAFQGLKGLLVLLVVVVVLTNVFFRVADYFATKAQSNALRDLYNYALEGLQKKSYTFYANSFAGGLVAKVKRFVRAFEVLHDQVVYNLWMHGLGLISSVVVLWYHSVQLGMVFVVWLVLYSILVRYMVRWSIPKSLDYAEADSKVTGHLADILANTLTVKMFGAREREQRGFEDTTDEENTKRVRSWMQNGFWNSMYQGIAVGVFELGMIAIAIYLWGMGVASAGLLLLVVLYVTKSFNIVWQLSRNVINISTALTDANEMIEILDAPEDIQDPKSPQKVRMEEGAIHFAQVTYSYEHADTVVHDLTLNIAPGERVALVGHSGAGKTTIVKLLLRFVDVTDGAITIDEQDVRAVSQDVLRRKIAYVPQEPLLFHRSLFENIAYGKTDATKEEVEEVARRARAHDFIVRLPQGYDTLVGERGVKLSGGERQRVAIARALLKDAPVVVLDEATSSLDSVSERFIQTAFDELMAGRTTIVIAHRLSTIQHMDRIIVLDKGAVAEQGTHSELLAEQGIYAELWNSQVGGFIKE